MAGVFSTNSTISGVISTSGVVTDGYITDNLNPIQGQCLTITHHVATSDTVYSNLHEDDLKRLLVAKMAEEMYRQNAIEFTRSVDPRTHEIVYRARIFVVPDDQVRLLRTAKVIK